jgi:HEPN domain-containing protein
MMDEATRAAVGRWLLKARNDLRTGETMLSVDPPVMDTACFHAQQCVEKCLKAFLTFAERHVERTHSLPRLVALCSEVDPAFEELADTAVELTDYAVAQRYPEHWREIPLKEATAAVRLSAEALSFVRSRLEIKGFKE